MRKLFMLSFLLVRLCSYAQVISFTSDEFSGIQHEINSSHNNYILLNDNEFLYAGGKVNSSDMTLYKMNRSCKKLWSVDVDGFIYAAKLNNNILVFYTNSKSANTVHAEVLSSEKGQVITEKEIPATSKKALANFYLLNDSNQDFQYLLIRTTREEGPVRRVTFKSQQKGGYTDNLQAISFDEKLNIKTVALNATQIQNAQFISCTCNNKGDIFTASIENNVLSINRFNVGSSEISATITAETNFENDITNHGRSFMKTHANSIVLSCALEEDNKLGYTSIKGIFNFDNNKGIIAEDIMDKKYVYQYASKSDVGFTEINTLGFELYKDKIIIIKEAKADRLTINRDAMYFIYRPLIIEFYDYNKSKIKELQANIYFQAFITFSTTGYKILNNKLYLFCNTNKGFKGIGSKYQTIDLDDFSASKDIEFDIDPKLASVLYGPGIIWFNDIALLPFARQESPLSPNKYATKFKGTEFKIN